MFIGHLDSFLCEMAVQVFCLYFFELYFKKFICRGSLHRVKISPFCIVDTFSGSMNCLFILLMGSFGEETILILI